MTYTNDTRDEVIFITNTLNRAHNLEIYIERDLKKMGRGFINSTSVCNKTLKNIQNAVEKFEMLLNL